MTKKIFSILTCFMLCFSAMFMLTGCSEDDNRTPLSEVEAMEVITNAKAVIEEEVIISMTGTMHMSLYGETISMDISSVATEFESYMRMHVSYEGVYVSNVESWYVQEDDWYVYSKTTEVSYEEVEPVVETHYLKQALEGFLNPKDSTIGQYVNENLGEFIKAYVKEDGETVIMFEQLDEYGILDDAVVRLTVKDGVIRKIKFTVMMFEIECDLKYGEEVTLTIPELPSPEGGWGDGLESPEDDPIV